MGCSGVRSFATVHTAPCSNCVCGVSVVTCLRLGCQMMPYSSLCGTAVVKQTGKCWRLPKTWLCYLSCFAAPGGACACMLCYLWVWRQVGDEGNRPLHCMEGAAVCHLSLEPGEKHVGTVIAPTGLCSQLPSAVISISMSASSPRSSELLPSLREEQHVLSSQQKDRELMREIFR